MLGFGKRDEATPLVGSSSTDYATAKGEAPSKADVEAAQPDSYSSPPAFPSVDETRSEVSESQVEHASIRTLLQFADSREIMLIGIGLVLCAIAGALLPLMVVLLSGTIDDFGACNDITSTSSLEETILKPFGILALVILVARTISSWCLETSQKMMVARYRVNYMKAIIRQDIAWFDVSNPQELSTQFGDSMSTIEKGLGFTAFGMLANGIGSSIGALVVAFMYQPSVSSLELIFVLPTAYSVYVFMQTNSTGNKKKNVAYARAGGFATETLSSIRTVAALGAEQPLLQRYRAALTEAMTAGILKQVHEGVVHAWIIGVSPLMLAVGYLFGGYLLSSDARDGEVPMTSPDGVTSFCTDQCSPYDYRFALNALDTPITAPLGSCGSRGFNPFVVTCLTASCLRTSPMSLAAFGFTDVDNFSNWASAQGGHMSCGVTSGDIFIVATMLHMLGQGLGQIPPALGELTSARRACAAINKVIDRMPPIDSFSDAGEALPTVEGRIVLENVVFAYPTAPQLKVLNMLSFTIEAGEQVALSGPSGSGKSSIIALIERFYDPLEGCVSIDGRDLRTLNVRSLRSHIGLVSQEPLLFAGTVTENIAYGKFMCVATQAEIEEAAKAANAHDFVHSMLSDGYDTQVGSGGSKLSGGQKQRIAIARAMIAKPAILLLDEATSALDSASERDVLTALDSIQATTKRTTITIAHRLSTIRNADKIYVMRKGSIVESGTWDELNRVPNGVFAELAQKQEEAAREDARLAAAALAPTEEKSEADEQSGAGKKADAAEGEGAGKKADAPTPKLRTRLLEMREPGDTSLLIIGLFCSVYTAIAMPLTMLFTVYMILALLLPNPDDLWSDTLLWSSVTMALAVVAIVCTSLESWAFGTVGEHVTRNLRYSLMRRLVRMDMGFFDVESNSTGELTTFLAEKVKKASLLAGREMADTIRLVLLMSITMIFIFVYGHWTFALICLAFAPVEIIFAVLMLMGMGIDFSAGTYEDGVEDEEERVKKKNLQKELEQKDQKGAPALPSGGISKPQRKKTAGQMIGEVALGIRTLASCNAEVFMYQQYEDAVMDAHEKHKQVVLLTSIASGVGNAMTVFILGLKLYMGELLMINGVWGDPPSTSGCDVDNTFFLYLFVPLMLMINLMQTLVQMSSSLAGVADATLAAQSLFKRLDQPLSPRDPFSEEGIKLASIKGDVSINEVVFAYPTRPDFRICHGYSLEIKAGQVCALCGPSGAGKSTIINLIERFYDPIEGFIRVDGHDISTLNLKWFRQQIGYVGQEPVLFTGSVRDNIAMGRDSPVSQAEIEEAARMANAHGFIVNDLANGYDAQIGLRGGRLSGGQKQRVAIARAILRKPAIMLLDEATSALDNVSEKLVQAALDDLMAKQKKTTILIAHRLSTIRHADKIAVVKDGKIVEEGSHAQLMGIGGVYLSLVQAQAGAPSA